MRKLLVSALMLLAGSVSAQEIEEHNMLMDHGGGHLMDMGGGMVMGQNTDTLPDGCDKIAAVEEVTVHAGHKYAEKFPGTMFAFDKQEYQYEPCTKLTIHFINEDHIRHQWMMHGLPKYLYPKGMFHLEVTGPGKISGTLILPPGDKTYLVHCDLAQHMEKGMKGQLKTGNGGGDLPSIPGVTDLAIADDYTAAKYSGAAAAGAQASVDRMQPTGAVQETAKPENKGLISGMLIIGLAIGFLATPYLMRKFKGMSAGEIAAYLFELCSEIIGRIAKILVALFNGIKAMLPKK
ncbi:MAG: copper oxidase [Gammaproteobacteria bacterium]